MLSHNDPLKRNSANGRGPKEDVRHSALNSHNTSLTKGIEVRKAGRVYPKGCATSMRAAFRESHVRLCRSGSSGPACKHTRDPRPEIDLGSR
eukprot:2742970-Pyramimonas_sp.AAC.1